MTNPPEPASATRGPYAPPGPPQRSKSPTKVLVIMVSVVLGLAALGLAALFVYVRFYELTGAEVGDCLAGDIEDPYSIAITECGTQDARYEVVGKVEDKTMADFESDAGERACTRFDRAEYLYFEGFGDDAAASGAILCLAEPS